MRFLIILGSGGHTSQMLKLVDLLGKEHDYEYIVASSDKLSSKKIKIRGPVFTFPKTRIYGEPLIISIIKQIIALPKAINLIRKTKSENIVTCGPNFAIPIMIAGKLFGKKIIFIETWSRIYKKSLTGRFGYRIADLFFVQWPEMKKLYPKAIYAGRFS